jgi:putative transposase
VSPDRRRRAVTVLRDRFRVSERRACRTVGQHRSAQRRRPRPVADAESALRTRLRDISARYPRWGWRKAHAIAAREGLVVNRKSTRRRRIELGLKHPARVRKKQRCGPARHQRMRAQAPDQLGALDFQVDVTIEGRQVRFMNIIDEYTREALATEAARSFTADATVTVLDELVATLGRRPAHLRMDNGPELTAHALADWCRFTGVDPAYIDPGSPWQNGICESFNGRFRDEFLTCEQFNTLLEVQVLAEDWRIEYNTYRPHGSLDGLTPEAFRTAWINNQNRLS